MYIVFHTPFPFSLVLAILYFLLINCYIHSLSLSLSGVDLLITISDSVICPLVVELHPSPQLRPHFLECGMGGWDGNNRGTGWNREGCLGSLLHSPLARSQCYLMKGKTVLIIGAGGFSKKFVWEAASQYGLKVRSSQLNITPNRKPPSQT